MNQPTYTIASQIALLKHQGMLFKDESVAYKHLKRYGYYRLEGYWLDELDASSKQFQRGVYFEDMLKRYDFDRKLRFVLFPGIEQIEIGVRTRLVYLLSASYGKFWYLNPGLFERDTVMRNGIVQTMHLHTLDRLREGFNRTQEPFIMEYHRHNPGQPAAAWRLMEVASFGTLAKLYKCLDRNLKERGIIAKEMGINSPRVFIGWLESISHIRNIIAHHARLWNRVMIKCPRMHLNSPLGAWFANPLTPGQLTKPFSTISCIVYLCNHLTESDELKHQILSLIKAYPNVPISKYGFSNHWDLEPIWREGK
jgi:abortive infection bacteriophage resistance protein